MAAAKGIFGFGDIRTVQAAAQPDSASDKAPADETGARSQLELVLPTELFSHCYGHWDSLLRLGHATQEATTVAWSC
eukprot:COSAG02_NODE_69_length_42323_cov_23.507850_46_plen_77_part_00